MAEGGDHQRSHTFTVSNSSTHGDPQYNKIERRLSEESNRSSTTDSVPDNHDCDYEPALEFDDTELVQVVEGEVEMDQEFESDDGFIESPISDGIMEENFEEALFGDHFAKPDDDDEECEPDDDFSDIAKYGIVDVAGDDSFGRKVIVIYACHLPSNKILNHAKFLRYLMHTLDQYVENDYTLVYFHFGLNRTNKPPLGWLWEAYKAFDRKYKKNLKALYLVHPTNFIRVFWQLFRRVISSKFGKKVMYVNYLHELKEHLHFDQLVIPPVVVEHDKKITANLKSPPSSSSSNTSNFHVNLPKYETQQFHVSLSYIKEHAGGDPIPRVVRECIEYLNNDTALETEGIFRRCANTKVIKEVQALFDQGKEVNFDGYQDIHIPAVILKSFLRELDEPLLTYDLYEDVISFQELDPTEKLPVAKSLVLDRLPEDNYIVLKYLVEFLEKVVDRSDLNKMTTSNLAIVFGPNLLWSQNKQASLSSIGLITHFTEFLLKYHDLIFVK